MGVEMSHNYRNIILTLVVVLVLVTLQYSPTEASLDSNTLAENSCLKPLYRYWHPQRLKHFYTSSWQELGSGKDGWTYQGYVGYVASTSDCYAPDAVPLWRFWHPERMKHFYTANPDEAAAAEAIGFTEKQVVGYVLLSADGTYDTQNLYRYYKEATDDHFLTNDWEELGDGADGFALEGTVAYVFRNPTCLTPLYRYWHPIKRKHFYATDWNEMGYGSEGWIYEGVEKYVADTSNCFAPNAQPLWRLWHEGRQKHFYATDPDEKDSAIAQGFQLEGVLGYILLSDNSEYETRPLYRYYKSETDDHFCTTNNAEIQPGQDGWSYEGVLGYVFDSPDAPPPPPIARPITPSFPDAGCVPYFSQEDSRWKNHPLRGSCSNCQTIGDCGCTLTSAAMLFQYFGADLTPDTLSDCMGNKACPFYWAEGSQSCSSGTAAWTGKKNFSWQNLENELNQKNVPIILGMSRKNAEGKTFTHYVLVLSGSGDAATNYLIHDPGVLQGNSMSLKAYLNSNSNWKAHGLYPYQYTPGGTPPCQSTSGIDTTSTASSPHLTLETDDPIEIYRMTSITMTVHLNPSNVASEMLIWTDNVSNTTWQPFSEFVYLPVSEKVYVTFRDTSGNESEVSHDTLFPETSPSEYIPPLFLPLVVRN